MASYLSSLTNHYSNLKRLLPTSHSPDSDLTISNPADSHVSRVLRAYYTEKGRPFPQWLGPDPSAPVAPAKPALVTPSPSASGSAADSLRSSRGSGGLGDLFADSSNSPNASAEPLSLRQKIRSPAFRGGSSDSIPYPLRSGASPSPSSQPIQPPTQDLPSHRKTESVPSSLRIGRPSPSSQNLQPAAARPLPSQRAGSYQTRGATPPNGSSSSLPSANKESTAQERLKARLGGGSRTGSPSYDSGRNSGSSAGSFNPYESTGSGGMFNPYEAPIGGSNPYGSSTDNGAKTKPYAGASSPWITGDELGVNTTGRRGPGLPSSPRRRG